MVAEYFARWVGHAIELACFVKVVCSGGGDAANRLLACVDAALCVVMPAVTAGVVEQAAESADAVWALVVSVLLGLLVGEGGVC